MEVFFEAWQKKYDDSKYPRRLYFESIQAIRKANNPSELGDAIIQMLHWKDGKVRLGFENKYIFSKPKPNTYSEKRHLSIIKSPSFFHFTQDIIHNEEFKPNNLDIIKELGLWDQALIMPAFVLHLLSPLVYPLYDQHVERAKAVLTAKSIKETTTLRSYIEYRDFFYGLVSKPDLERIKYVDEALWSFGKWLKQFGQKNLQLNNHEEIEDTSAGTYTPDSNFKAKVMVLVKSGYTQLNAMRQVSQEYGIMLPESYYLYPGSHINRWRKQGF